MNLVAEVDASFQELTHREFWQSQCTSPVRLAAADRRALNPTGYEVRMSECGGIYAVFPEMQPEGAAPSFPLSLSSFDGLRMRGEVVEGL
jgi:hypothetical protein